MHPGAGPAAKLTLTACLAEAARHIHLLKQPGFDDLPEDVQRQATHLHPLTLGWGPAFGDRFSEAEADELWRRFDWLAQRLHADPREPRGPVSPQAGAVRTHSPGPSDSRCLLLAGGPKVWRRDVI